MAPECYRAIEWVGYEMAICGVHQVPWPCVFTDPPEPYPNFPCSAELVFSEETVTMPALSRIIGVLPLASDRQSDRSPWFQPTPDSDLGLRGLRLGRNEWVDMGSPDQITVTVEPGDVFYDADERSKPTLLNHQLRGVPIGVCDWCGRAFEPAEHVPRDCLGGEYERTRRVQRLLDLHDEGRCEDYFGEATCPHSNDEIAAEIVAELQDLL